MIGDTGSPLKGLFPILPFCAWFVAVAEHHYEQRVIENDAAMTRHVGVMAPRQASVILAHGNLMPTHAIASATTLPPTNQRAQPVTSLVDI